MAGEESFHEPTVTMTEMKEKHLAAVIQIESQSFSSPWSFSLFRKILRNGAIRASVLLREEMVIGYAVFWVAGGHAELSDIAVDREFRGRGFGDFLLRGVIEACKVLGARSLFLEVRESNSTAQALYRKTGFSEIMKRRGYYSKPLEDALVFGLDFEISEDGA